MRACVRDLCVRVRLSLPPSPSLSLSLSLSLPLSPSTSAENMVLISPMSSIPHKNGTCQPPASAHDPTAGSRVTPSAGAAHNAIR